MRVCVLCVMSDGMRLGFFLFFHFNWKLFFFVRILSSEKKKMNLNLNWLNKVYFRRQKSGYALLRLCSHSSFFVLHMKSYVELWFVMYAMNSFCPRAQHSLHTHTHCAQMQDCDYLTSWIGQWNRTALIPLDEWRPYTVQFSSGSSSISVCFTENANDRSDACGCHEIQGIPFDDSVKSDLCQEKAHEVFPYFTTLIRFGLMHDICAAKADESIQTTRCTIWISY